MKRIFGLIAVVAMLFCLTACNDNTVSESKGDKVAKENEIHDTLVSENSNNKENVPEELTVDYVKNYPVTDASQFEIEEVDGGVSINQYTGSDSIVVIPEAINGKPVVAIEIRAFLFDDIKAVKLADSIKEIGREAFMGCKNLEIFICGRGLEIIKEYGLSSCTSLKYLELNEGLKILETLAIPHGKLTELYVPASVETIMDGGIFMSTEIKIICEEGSVAESYAKKFNMPYEVR